VSWSSATAHRTSRSFDAASHHLLPCEFMARHRYSGATSRLSVTAPSVDEWSVRGWPVRRLQRPRLARGRATIRRTH
jgi:hypothetical protein